MFNENTSVIALIGISSHEVRVIQTICLISKNRSHSYVLQDEVPSLPADIVVVDQDNPHAMSAWRNFQVKHQMVTAIMLTRQPATDPSLYQLVRPLMATRLLHLLDQMPGKQESPAFVTPQKDENRKAENTASEKIALQVTPDVQEMGTGSRALVVDDSLPVRQQIGLHLTPLIEKVDLVEDGEQAMQSIANRSYDIIFLDVVLPGMDGYKICREIKRNKRTKQTPVIMLTGKTSPFDMVKGKLAGCDTYLTKPVDGTTFAEVVRKYLKKRLPTSSMRIEIN